MTTTIYNLRSNPKMSLAIPTEHYEKASRLVDLALKSKNMNELYEKMNQEEPSLTEVYVPDATLRLIYNKEGSLKLQDMIYLETCYHMINDELATMDGNLTNGHEYRARERYDAIRNHQAIKRTLESLK
jgi:hypothetical protein